MAKLTEAQKKRRERIVLKLKQDPKVDEPYALATWIAQHPYKGGYYRGKKAGNV